METEQENRPKLDFEATTIGLLRNAVAHFGDKDFIIEPDRRITYAQADALSRTLAKRLILMGVTKGTRVAAKYPNGISWVVAWLAVTRIGGFFMPLSSAYTLAETRKCLRIGDAEFFLMPERIVGKDQRPVVADILEGSGAERGKPLLLHSLPYLRHVVLTAFGDPSGDDVLDISAPDAEAQRSVSDTYITAVEAEVTPADWMLAIFTSGSTSDPKCVIHTHGAPIRHATAINLVNQWTASDRIFAGMPFFWVGGNCYTVMPVMMVGAAIVCMERFEAGAALDLMEREGATRAIGWPGVINPLLDHPSLSQRSIRAFDDPIWHPSVGAMTGLGMSETGSNHSIVLIEDRHMMGKDGFVGRPIPHIEHRIVDEASGEMLPEGATGNIQLRGYSLMAGFYKREREDTFMSDGFYDTQDRGFLRDGYLFFQGRDVGLIKTAGNNVSALEVEAVIKAIPSVANAFVVGLPDDRIGQIVGAAIVPKPGEAVDLDTISARLKADLSSYKVPKVIRLVRAEDIPFMPNGKLDFRALVAKIAEE